LDQAPPHRLARVDKKRFRRLAGMILNTDEERFREFVRELVRRAILISQCYDHIERLARAYVVLGSIRPDERKYGGYGTIIVAAPGGGVIHVEAIERMYEAIAEVPLCRERYSNSQGVFYAIVTGVHLKLECRCVAGGVGIRPAGTSTGVAIIRHDGLVEMRLLWTLYDLYKFFYKEIGTGARPLLDLADQAEKRGDEGVAGVLKRLYTLLEASKGTISEIEQKDYSSVEAAVDEREVEKRVEEAVGLLRKAKELAKEGNTERLIGFVIDNKLVLSRWYIIWLDEIVRYLETGRGMAIEEILSEDIGEIVKEIDICNAALTVANLLGLEVRWQLPKAQTPRNPSKPDTNLIHYKGRLETSKPQQHST